MSTTSDRESKPATRRWVIGLFIAATIGQFLGAVTVRLFFA